MLRTTPKGALLICAIVPSACWKREDSLSKSFKASIVWLI